jgi:hypothetical protein
MDDNMRFLGIPVGIAVGIVVGAAVGVLLRAASKPKS